jgi:DNA polymerase
MTPIQYVLDPRFETIGCGVAMGDGAPFWLEGHDEVRDFLRTMPANDIAMVTHNALFDACVTEWIFDFSPKLMIDTMSMARALVVHKSKRVSLDAVAKHLELGVKGGTVHNVVGMGREAIRAAGMMPAYAQYCINDVELCRGIFKKLRPDFPPAEFIVNDMVIRCATKPQFQADKNKLAVHLAEVKAAKQGLLSRVGLDSPELLMSADRFAGALRLLGVEPPTKTSPTTGELVYAFAKTDPGLIALEEHDNPEVQALVAARLGHKSTLEETRTQRFIDISNLTLPGKGDGWLPVPLKFSGAHTHRFSGDWSLNMQNLPSRGDTTIRDAMVAHQGHKVMKVDASQIEARLVAWLAGQDDLVALFAAGADVYSSFASDIYGRPVDRKKVKSDFLAGLLGKISILGLGFQMGPPRFQDTVRIQGAAEGLEITIEESGRVVGLYRRKYDKIKGTWEFLQGLLPSMASDKNLDIPWGPVRIQYRGVLLPNGLRLYYDDLRFEDGAWKFTFAGKTKFIYGGKLLENIVQALDRVAVMEAAMRIRSRCSVFDLQMAHQVHDELVYVVPDDLVDVIRPILLEEMSRRPKWGHDLPLAAEVGVGVNYGACK